MKFSLKLITFSALLSLFSISAPAREDKSYLQELHLLLKEKDYVAVLAEIDDLEQAQEDPLNKFEIVRLRSLRHFVELSQGNETPCEEFITSLTISSEAELENLINSLRFVPFELLNLEAISCLHDAIIDQKLLRLAGKSVTYNFFALMIENKALNRDQQGKADIETVQFLKSFYNSHSTSEPAANGMVFGISEWAMKRVTANPDQGLSIMEGLLREIPDMGKNSTFVQNTAAYYYGSKDYENALEHYLKALEASEETDPVQASIYLGLARTYLELNMFDEARKASSMCREKSVLKPNPHDYKVQARIVEDSINRLETSAK